MPNSAANKQAFALQYKGAIDFKPELQADGRYAVRGVPIFETHERDGIGKVDSKWMYACCDDQKLKAANGFKPRLIVGHTTEDGTGPEKPVVGFLDNYRFDAKDGWLYADYVDIAPEDLPLLKRFPGRSAEASVTKPAINTVALLGRNPALFQTA
jgi:hypothetical protein